MLRALPQRAIHFTADDHFSPVTCSSASTWLMSQIHTHILSKAALSLFHCLPVWLPTSLSRSVNVWLAVFIWLSVVCLSFPSLSFCLSLSVSLSFVLSPSLSTQFIMLLPPFHYTTADINMFHFLRTCCAMIHLFTTSIFSFDQHISTSDIITPFSF